MRKVLSGFGLVVSFIVMSVVLFNVSFKGPRVSLRQNVAGKGDVVHKNHEANVSVVSEKGDVLGSNGVGINLGKTNGSVVGKNGAVLGSNGEGMSLGETHVGNFTKVKNGSSTLVEGRGKEKSQFVNGSDTSKCANFTKSEGEEVALGKTHTGNLSEKVEKGSLTHDDGRVENGSEIGKKANSAKSDGDLTDLGTTHVGNFSEEVKNGSFGGGDVAGKSVNEVSLYTSVNKATGDGNVSNLSNNVGNLGCHRKGVPCSSIEKQRISSEKKNTIIPSNDPQPVKKQKDSIGKCDLFDGRWVRNEMKPYYPMGSCPFIDKDFDCHLNRRPDSEYLNWKWKPYGCDIPSFNATDFLERLRGKKLIFVGDSLNRNMWESLVCILRQSDHNKERLYEISGKTEFKKKGFYAFRHEDYNCTVDFVNTPYLVRELTVKRKKGPLETLRLDLMDETTPTYADADVVVFNTGHWWTHEKNQRGEYYYQEGNHVYPRLHVLKAFKKALKTWGRWVDKNIDGSRTQVIFRGFSSVHFSGGQWNSGGQCHRETNPILDDKFLIKYPAEMKVLENVFRKMKTNVIYLNISRLTDYRKDGHPSIYRGLYNTVNEQIAADQIQDCSHWCLPGIPDTWNELLYASLLQAGKGSWKS